jgi:hypothetical protein
MIARPMPGRPTPGGGLAVLVVVTVLAVLAAPQLGRLRPLVDQLRRANLPSVLPHQPTPPHKGPRGGVCPVNGPVRIGQGWGVPRDGGRRRHQGIDLLAPAGTPWSPWPAATSSASATTTVDAGASACGSATPMARLTTTPTTSTTWSTSASASGLGRSSPGSGPPATPAVAHPISTFSSIPAAAARSAPTQ